MNFPAILTISIIIFTFLEIKVNSSEAVQKLPDKSNKNSVPNDNTTKLETTNLLNNQSKETKKKSKTSHTFCKTLKRMLENQNKQKRDVSRLYGEYIASKHRTYSIQTQNLVEYFIGKIFFNATMGFYDNKNPTIIHSFSNNFAQQPQTGSSNSSPDQNKNHSFLKNIKNLSESEKLCKTLIESIKKKKCRENNDASTIYGKHITFKFRLFSNVTQNIVEHLVENVLFNASMGFYEKNTFSNKTKTTVSQIHLTTPKVVYLDHDPTEPEWESWEEYKDEDYPLYYG